MRPQLDSSTHVLVLTGAGVSAESGLATFRGADGLWCGHRIEDVASPQGFEQDPSLVWEFYSQRRAEAAQVKPNPGHLALAALEAQLGDRFLLATQNVDGLHRRAGNQRQVELHGHLFTTRCSECDRPPFPDERVFAHGQVPECEHCGGRLRPHIVWFGEMLDPADLDRVEAFLEAGSRKRLLFLAVGTSGVVYPAAGLVAQARDYGAETWLVNMDPADNGRLFHHFVRGKSGEILSSWFGANASRQ